MLKKNFIKFMMCYTFQDMIRLETQSQFPGNANILFLY